MLLRLRLPKTRVSLGLRVQREALHPMEAVAMQRAAPEEVQKPRQERSELEAMTGRRRISEGAGAGAGGGGAVGGAGETGGMAVAIIKPAQQAIRSPTSLATARRVRTGRTAEMACRNG